MKFSYYRVYLVLLKSFNFDPLIFPEKLQFCYAITRGSLRLDLALLIHVVHNQQVSLCIQSYSNVVLSFSSIAISELS